MGLSTLPPDELPEFVVKTADAESMLRTLCLYFCCSTKIYMVITVYTVCGLKFKDTDKQYEEPVKKLFDNFISQSACKWHSCSIGHHRANTQRYGI